LRICKAFTVIEEFDRRIQSPTTTQTFSGKVGDIDVHLAHVGKVDKFGVDHVGTNGATLAAYLAIQAFNPSVVISAGTAGGFISRGAEIASIFVSTACMYHDRRIPLPGFDVFGVHKEDTHNVAKLVKDLGTFLLYLLSVELINISANYFTSSIL
jgi:5'-methylthioadenosine nucleosidase